MLLLSSGIYAAVLTDNGKSLSEIVVPRQAASAELYAAKELQQYVKRASGVTLPIISEDKAADNAKYKIWIGATNAAAKAKLNPGNLPPAGFILKTTPEGLFMLGHDTNYTNSLSNLTNATGTLYAVYEWLERELGVRWLWPDDQIGTVVRSRPRISSGNYNICHSPRFERSGTMRLPWVWERRAGRVTAPVLNFPDGRIGHAFMQWHKIYGKEHPDWFARSADGKRQADRISSMCVSNPEFHKEIVKRWEMARQLNPGKDFIVNCCENDTQGTCTCPNCTAWDGPDIRFSFQPQTGITEKNVGERYAKFYLSVWKLASKIDPSARVFGYAYSNYIYGPRKTKLNENITVFMVPPTGEVSFPYPPRIEKELRDNLRLWEQSGASLYYRPNIYGGYVMPENYVTQYYDEFQSLLKANMKGLIIDGPNMAFATQGPLLYVMVRLIAHPEAKLDTLLNEYYAGFGKAAPAVKAYWEYWNKYTIDNTELFYKVPIEKNTLRHKSFFGFHYALYAHILFPQSAFAPARKLLEKAARAVTDSPDDSARVKFLQEGLEHAAICSEACEIFANPQATTEEKLAVLKKVNNFRKSLSKWAYDSKLCTANGWNESTAWTFPDFDPKRMLELPVEWDVRFDPKNQGEIKKYFSGNNSIKWEKIMTDRFLEDQGHSDYHNAWYRLNLEIPGKFRGKRTVLHLGAVDESCKLWVNGKFIGKFTFDGALDPASWRKPLEFDITPALNSDGRNLIVLKVNNQTGKGGLWRPSRLHFFDASTDTPVNGKFFEKDISIKLKLWGAGKYSFLEPQFDGTCILKIVGRPDMKGNRGHCVGYHLPFKYVAGRTFTFGAKCKVENHTSGNFLISLVQLDKDRKTVNLDSVSVPSDGKWHNVKKTVKINSAATELMLYFGARALNRGATGYVKSFFASPKRSK